MLARHPSSQSAPQPRFGSAAAPAGRAFAATTGLTLPSLPADIVTGFEVQSRQVATFAEGLVTAGLPLHWPEAPGSSLLDAVTAALTGLGQRERGPGLAQITLTVTDDLDSVVPIEECYVKDRNGGRPLPQSPSRGSALSAFVIGINMQDDMHIATVGPRLAALARWARVGPSVMKILSRGLGRCTNSINPHNALDWASAHYWQGEKNESGEMKDELKDARCYATQQVKKGELKKMPADAELSAQMSFFTRAQFDAAIPREFTGGRFIKHLPETLDAGSLANLSDRFAAEAGSAPPEITWAQTYWPAIRAACLAIQSAARADTTQDRCEQTAWECIPIMLRWAEDDCLIRIMDDTINHLFECGDLDLSANAVFLFHDQPTLVNALARLTNFLRLTRACEALIQLLTTHIHRQRQP